jgi:hypothetical protein
MSDFEAGRQFGRGEVDGKLRARIERLEAKLTQVYSIVPGPSPLTDADYTDAIKLKWFEQLRAFLYQRE